MTGERITVPIDALAPGGAGLGRDASGRVVFVDGALPGETVQAEVTDQRADYARAVLVEFPAQPSADRLAEPRCPLFGTWPERGTQPERFCGGCQWQHITYAAQLRHKTAIVIECLRRQGGLPNPPVAPMDDPGAAWHYRNQLRLSAHHGQPSLVAVDGQHLVPIQSCPIAHERTLELAHALTGDLPDGLIIDVRAGIATGDGLILLTGSPCSLQDVDVVTDRNVSVVIDRGRGLEVAAGLPYLVEWLAGQPFIIPATSFFQANTTATERLVAHVREMVGDPVATLLDLYSGVGTFAVLLADRARLVYAVELDPAAAAAAVENAAGLKNLVIVEGRADEALSELDLQPEVAVVDPPRRGLDRDTLRLLSTTVRSRIVYVSCDPVTLARDARRLLAAGWALSECRPLDMFPQTRHIETVSLFTRSQNG